MQTRLTPEQRRTLERFQSPDEKLYFHFKAKLDRQILRFGLSRMRKGLEELDQMNDHVRRRWKIFSKI